MPKSALRVALPVFLATVAQATVVERVSLEDLVARSSLIAQGRAVRSWAAWDASTRAIWTHTELLIEDGLKGTPARSIVVSEPGGVVDGVGMMIEGVPRYQVGEHVVVFLYRTPQGLWRTRGLGQGKFTVTDALRVRTNVAGAALVEPLGAERQRGLRPDKLEGLAVDEFLGLVRGLMLQPRGGSR